MAYLRQYPWFGAALLFLGLLLMAELGGLYERRSTARRVELQLERKRRELAKLNATVPGPTIENASAVAADLARAEKTLAEIEGQLRGSAGSVEAETVQPPSAKQTDLFFTLADFVERFRARFAATGIGFGADERFGFSAYAYAGPEPALIPAVQRQHRVIEYLVEALLAAQPHRLLGVERERPRAPAPRNALAVEPAGLREPLARDLFAIDPAISARANGLVETDGFRVGFVGQTAVLRTFLRRLAGFELPVLVRAIEVAPAGLAESSLESAAGESVKPATTLVTAAPAIEAPLPMVRSALSKFTVTVELIELTAASPTS